MDELQIDKSPATTDLADAAQLTGQGVLFVGKLAGMSKRAAQQLVRERGGLALNEFGPELRWVVVGEEQLLDQATLGELAEGAIAAAAERNELQVVTETQFWQQLNLVESQQFVHRLYTPSMLADLLGLPVAVIRRWHRRGLIVPTREVRRLAYFDFQEVATARRLAELLAAGVSPQAIEKQLAQLHRLLPEIQRPLAQLSVIVEGKHLLLRQGDGLLAPGGQLWIDFEAATDQAAEAASADNSHPSAAPPAHVLLARPPGDAPSQEELLAAAAEFEDSGQLDAAADLYHAALAWDGPRAESCFRLAELLYRQGDLDGARERYYMAIELDEDYVEARANLGCVLAEQGRADLAIAAFEGALAFHADYPDAHYHLARLLDEAGRGVEARRHWEAFVEQAPESPWAAEARARLAESLLTSPSPSGRGPG